MSEESADEEVKEPTPPGGRTWGFTRKGSPTYFNAEKLPGRTRSGQGPSASTRKPSTNKRKRSQAKEQSNGEQDDANDGEVETVVQEAEEQPPATTKRQKSVAKQSSRRPGDENNPKKVKARARKTAQSTIPAATKAGKMFPNRSPLKRESDQGTRR